MYKKLKNDDDLDLITGGLFTPKTNKEFYDKKNHSRKFKNYRELTNNKKNNEFEDDNLDL